MTEQRKEGQKMAKITLIGANNFLHNNNSDMFSLLKLPEGIEKDVFTDTLMLRGGEFELLYGDPYFEQQAVGAWGRKWYRTFQKWIEALNIEYAPLENYDRYEDWTENEKTDDDFTGSTTGTDTQTERTDDDYSGTTTNNGTENETENKDGSTDRQTQGTATNSNSTENKVSAFNSSVYEPENMNTSTGTSSTTETVGETTEEDTTRSTTTTDRGTEESERDISRSYTGRTTGTEDTERDINRLNRRTGRAHGNIGVTTSQQMLESELNIAKWNLYDKMSDIFIRELLVAVYI